MNESQKYVRLEKTWLKRHQNSQKYLSLLTVMLQARNTCGHSLGLTVFVGDPTDISLTNVVAGPALWLVTRCTSATVIKELWKDKITYKSRWYMACPGPNNKVAVDRERGHEPEVLPLLGLWVGCPGFHGFTL